jgi:general secretion pathway protein A
MYTAFFGLSESPFNITPDHRFLFLSNHHVKALDHLRYGIDERKGFMVISGGVGTGKTTLCRTLLNELNTSVKTAFVFNTSLSDIELLETINQELGIETKDSRNTKKRQVDRLNQFLLDNHRRGGNAVLIIDEAQNLSRRVLEQLRMLSNLETDREKLIQIVLVGQPELVELLASPNLRQLRDRITVWFELKPLKRQDVQEYLEHRLVVAGNRGNVTFTKSGAGAVYAYSRGNPRRINAICDRALLIAYCRDELSIGRDIVRRARDDIQGDFSSLTSRLRWFPRKLAPVAAVLAVAFVLSNLGDWDLKSKLSGLFSAMKKVNTVQSRAFMRQPIELEAVVGTPRPFVRKPIEDQKQSSALGLTDKESLAILFRLFDVQEAEKNFATGDVYPGVFYFASTPEFYRMFARPFRIRIKPRGDKPDRFLVIKKVTTGGVIALDGDGNEWPVTEEYVLNNWDGEMSWVYPYEDVSSRLKQGMSGLAVLRVQQMLDQIGYSVEPRGIFDNATFEQLMEFQLNFGLKADGVVNTQTKALLYQTSKWT